MKKFLTSFCAIAIALCASAAPFAPKAELAKKAPVAVEQMQKVQAAAQFQLTPAMNANQLSAAPALKVTNQKGKMAPIANKRLMANHQAAPAKPAARKAANAVAEDINVTATSVYFSNYYGYLDYYMYVDGGAFDFSGIEPIEGKTYTLADMDADYTGWYSIEDEGYITTKATAATLTVSKKNGLPYVVGTMTIGVNNYTITYELKLTDTVTVNATNLAVKEHFYGGYEYTFNDANWTFDIVDFDMTSKTGTLQNVDFDYSGVYPTGGSSYDAYYFAAVVEDVVVAQDADTLKLTGAIAAENGILYILDARYEKPAAKEITLVADTLEFFTKMLTAGYYTVSGFNVDSKYEFSFYFISKSITGNFTEEDMDASSTWVDEKDGKKTLVSYQNLSAANIQVTLVKDTVYYTGTMTLATNEGQEANITLNLSCPFKQEWGEWADFAPFDKNTGKFNYATLGTYIQPGIEVLERKDNTGLKQYKLKNWGKGYYDAVGQDLILNMNPNYTFTFVSNPVNVGAEVILADVATAKGDPALAADNSYNPETGVFSFNTAVVFKSSGQIYTTAKETFVMDKPITERDTVNIVSQALTYNNLIATNGVVIYYVGDVEGYDVFRVTSNTTTVDGTFKWSDGTINEGNSYFTVEGVKNYFQDGEFTMVTTDAGTSLTGWVIGVDEKYYRLNWSKKAGVLDYDTNAPFEAEFAYGEMSASIDEGVIYISATNTENKTMGLVLFTDPAITKIPAGTYTISDTEEAGTALKSIGVSDGILTECWAGVRTSSGISDCWFIVEGTVTLSYDDYDKLKVVVDGLNSFGQPVKATVKYTKLDPKSEVTIEANNMSFEGAGTAFQLDAANTTYEVVLVVSSTDTAGTYSVEDLIGTYSAIYSAAGRFSILDGEFTLAVDGKNMTLTGSLLASDTIQYNLNITGYMGALPYDQEIDFEATFELDSAEVQTADAGTGMTNLIVTNDNNQMVALRFFAKAEGNKLPAGTYPINNTKAKNTILASQGYTTSGFTYSFAAETNDQGQITNPWWMVSGEVVVAEDGSITVNAVNSYDKTITINIVAAAPEVTDYYLVGWIDGAAYGIEGDIDNFGDYKFVDGKVTATFNKDSYVQVKDNNKQIYGTASYVDPVAEGTSAIVLATGTEKMGVYAGEYEFTLDIAEDGTMTLSYAPVATGLYRINANTAIRKALINGHVVIFKNNKAFNLMGAEL